MLVAAELRPSPIHGVGVFLLAPVKKGELIWQFDARLDVVYSRDAMEALPEFSRTFIKTYACWNKARDAWMLCGDHARYINHADKPSAYAEESNAFAKLFAAWDLNAGDEVTDDYRDCYDDPDMLASLNLS